MAGRESWSPTPPPRPPRDRRLAGRRGRGAYPGTGTHLSRLLGDYDSARVMLLAGSHHLPGDSHHTLALPRWARILFVQT
jgi:hypothetical protein